MDRKHYWLLANALRAVPNGDDKTETVLELCELLKAANPKFDPEKFIDACGI